MKKQITIESRISCYDSILLIGLTVFISLISLIGYSYTYRKQVMSDLMHMEKLTQNNIKGILDEAEQLSVRILSDSVIQENLLAIKDKAASGEEMNDYQYNKYFGKLNSTMRSHAMTADHIAAMQIVTTTGIRFSYKSDAVMTIDNVEAEPIYERNGKVYWYVSNDRDRIFMARAILDLSTMEPLGYMLLLYNNQYLCRYLESLDTPFLGNTYIIQKDGMILSAADRSLIGTIINTPLQKEDFMSSLFEDPSTGRKSYYFIAELEDTDWLLVIDVEAEKIWHTLRLLYYLIFLTVVLICVVSILINKKIILDSLTPAKELKECMRQFGNGDLNARMQISTFDEIGQIGDGYNQMAENIQNLLKKVYSLEIATKEAEIDYLKMQINPHFLYNTLDTISWLGFRNGNEDVSNLAVSLAKLLRFSISSERYVTIEREIDCIRDYLEIQEYRFKDRFGMKMEIDDYVKSYYMPKFLLQPLVENSFNHGLEGLVRKGQFLLRIRERAPYVEFLVCDDGAGISEEHLQEIYQQFENIKQNEQSSIGLMNVYRRLYLLYGDTTNFSIKSIRNKGTEISFRIPIINKISDYKNM